MEFSKELTAQLSKWRDEDDKNRAFIVLCVERTDIVSDEECSYNTNGTIQGYGGILIDALYHILTDDEKSNGLRKVIDAAYRRKTLDVLCGDMERQMERIEKLAKECGIDLSKEDGEQGKEGSHE